MQEKDSPTFQLGEDSVAHDEMLHDELQELRMEKLSHRVTLLTILIPCMIGIILVIAYLDIKDRVIRTQDTGTIGAQKLAKDIESKFSSLSLDQAKIKATLSKLPSLEDSSAFVQSRLKSMQKSLKQLESSSINQDELSQVLQDIQDINDKYNDINDKYNEIPAVLKTESQDLKTANNQLAEDTAELSGRFDQLSESLENIKESINRIDENIAAMNDQKISKSELDFALRLKEMAAKQSILDATTSLEKKIHSLEEEIRVLKKGADGAQQNSSTRESGPVQEGAANTQPQSKKIVGSAAQVQQKPEQPSDTQSSPLQSEGIVEQNIE